jgi:ABC-type multidrug transport system fused ATPase/permease subunit
MQFLVPIFIVGFVMGLLGWIAYVILEIVRTRHRIRATSELQAKLIDRLGAEDIGVFLTSDNGGRLLRALSEQPAGDGAHVRILRALQSGVVLVAVGVGLFVYAGTRALPLEGEDVAALFATLATALGVGLLAAAGASYRLSMRMGLLHRRTEDTDPARAA